MRQYNEHHSFQGMQRDIAISKHPSNMLYDARNIRITAREGDTLLTISNEKGVSNPAFSLFGTYLGHCLLHRYLVVFTTVSNANDYIYRVDLGAENMNALKTVHSGHLNFDTSHPIDAIASYENEHIQKVYWTDGKNQPRMVNIIGEMEIVGGVETEVFHYNDSSFDFIRELQLNEDVHIRKELGSGMFAPGVIQYALTYYTKHGQESNIFYTSPLLYISYRDRGAAPDDTQIGNSFKITVDNIDPNFDYLRIYSIQRTSLDGTPMCKRVQDIYLRDLNGTSVSFLDTGTTGNSVDPTELLYKGGESIVAGTIEQKDNTLFLGNIGLKREQIIGTLKSSIEGISVVEDTRVFYPEVISAYNTGYTYANQLTSYDSNGYSVPCGGFKRGNWYRCGVQFQYKDGKWSDPIFIEDALVTNTPSYAGNSQEAQNVTVPTLKATLTSGIVSQLYNKGYKKARAVVVYPEALDRVVVCQGVINPTLYTNNDRTLITSDNYQYKNQSSWFFRPMPKPQATTPDGLVSPTCIGTLHYTNEWDSEWAETLFRRVEIQGDFDDDDKFNIDWALNTLHSPDVAFDEQFSLLNLSSVLCQRVGLAHFVSSLADIDIQTETPPISTGSVGFWHKAFTEIASNKVASAGIVSGLFYEDYLVDDSDDKFEPYSRETSPVKWLVYPWQRSGSLNNDINRPTNAGVRSAVLKRKIISNLRYADSVAWDEDEFEELTLKSQAIPQVYNSDQVSILKIDSDIYRGNIDTLLNPTGTEGLYFAYGADTDDFIPVNGSGGWSNWTSATTVYTSNNWYRTYAEVQTSTEAHPTWNANAVYKYNKSNHNWTIKDQAIGDTYASLVCIKESVRMKYKSTPHIVLKFDEAFEFADNEHGLPVVELIYDSEEEDYYRDTMFGGNSDDALQANTWIPCGEAVKLFKIVNGQESALGTSVEFKYSWGDTYYQRWDCLKTYPFTPDDVNQVVEIGSFMLETYVNIDGRYDRNRGQLNNTMMSPLNFNLLNPVYSQVNNFFSYKILDKEFYKMTQFPNQITWSKEKQAGADTDLWTNITLASTYDMDGSKGEVISLNTWKDNIYCFQNKGVSAILFNSRVQIPTSDGVPIEITNNYKVDGYRYISDGIGCGDKRLIKETPAAVYFIDNVSKHLFAIGDGIQDVTMTHNMCSWFEDVDIKMDKLVYDDFHKDLYVLFKDYHNNGNPDALCFSEVLGQFTSFMDYGGASLIESFDGKVFALQNSYFYRLFSGPYNTFMGETRNQTYYPKYSGWHITFVSNGADQSMMDFDKIFSNIDYRMDGFSSNSYLPDNSFDTIRVWNEYQDTTEVPINAKKKFKIWRIQIPRNKKWDEDTESWRVTLDRIRNPWCKITLSKDAPTAGNSTKMVLQDLNVQYYV